MYEFEPHKFDKKRIRDFVILLALSIGIFYVGFFVGQKKVVCQICTPANVDFSLFWDAYNKLNDHFISPENITDEDIVYGAIAGMTKSLGDPYTDFFDPEQAKAFQQDLSGSFEGIGVEVGIKKEQLTVIAPLKGTPGERAGLMAGDLIIEVNGTSTADMSTDEAVRLIRGKKGTQVTLSIFREGWNETRDFVITRDTIKIDTISWELKNSDIAYIKINQFGQTLTNDFKKVAYEILSSPAKKIVVDLRNNPGGYLEVSQDVAGWFLRPGHVITIEDFGKGKEQELYKAEGNAGLAEYPVIVLINKGSASASEILAGALRDNRNVQLVGEKSFGKGSVQEVVPLRDGDSFLKVTIAKWLTPKGASISEVGLTPDVKIENTEASVAAGRDLQLEKALEIIGKVQ